MAKINKRFGPTHADIPSRWVNNRNRQDLGGRLKRAARQAEFRAGSQEGPASDQPVSNITMRAKLAAAIVLAGTLIGGHGVWAQAGGTIVGTPGGVSTTPVSPFAIIGIIQDFKLTPPRGPHVELSGATMTVNGQQIILPDNSVVIMPAAILTVYDIFHIASADKLASNLANKESGLALHDINP